jgi:hypothetical protein
MKLRNKLILSCAALAAVATTAVSTTFAWYTANTVVTASPINTASAASGSDMLMIADGIVATTANNTTTYAEVDALTKLDWKQNIAPTVTNNELMPLAYNSNGKILVDDKAGDPTTATTVAEVSWSSATANYATFILYFKNGSTTANQKLYVNGFTVKNVTGLTASEITAGTATTKAKFTEKPVLDLDTNYTHFGWTKDDNTGAISGHTNGTYKVDALRVLQLDVESHKSVGGVAGDSTEVCYDLETLADAQSTRITDDLPASGFNAHGYYNAVMDTDLTITTDKTAKTALNKTAGANYANALYLGELPSAATSDTINDCLRVEFKVFLNGWDLACFDACQGQKFRFELSFTTDAPTAQSATTYIYTA